MWIGFIAIADQITFRRLKPWKRIIIWGRLAMFHQVSHYFGDQLARIFQHQCIDSDARPGDSRGENLATNHEAAPVNENS